MSKLLAIKTLLYRSFCSVFLPLYYAMAQSSSFINFSDVGPFPEGDDIDWVFLKDLVCGFVPTSDLANFDHV
jgi:hypothetical protein